MTTVEHFRALLRERRRYKPGSLDHNWRTRAARKLLWIIRDVPPIDWESLERAHALHDRIEGN